MPLNFNRRPAAGETRDCTDPWKFAILRSNGDVSLCCRSQVLGNMKQKPVQEILEGPAATRMREDLLTGELSHDCLECSERGVTTLAALRQRVEGALYHEAVQEMEDLRRQVHEHREQRSTLMIERAQLQQHARTLESERDAMRAHIGNLEAERGPLSDERVHLVGHIANLERERAELQARLERKRGLVRRIRSALGLA